MLAIGRWTIWACPLCSASIDVGPENDESEDEDGPEVDIDDVGLDPNVRCFYCHKSARQVDEIASKEFANHVRHFYR